MSKTALRKELALLDAPKLREMILDMYGFKLTPRDYFDFYFEPDAEALLAKYKEAIRKEATRQNRRGLCGRITVVNRLIKAFDSYNTGADYSMQLKLDTICVLLTLQRHFRMPDSLANGSLKLIKAYISDADRSLCADKAIRNINTILDNKEFGTPAMKNQIRNMLMQLSD